MLLPFFFFNIICEQKLSVVGVSKPKYVIVAYQLLNLVAAFILFVFNLLVCSVLGGYDHGTVSRGEHCHLKTI